jgi:hypothetical protein
MSANGNWLANVMASAAAALPCFGGRSQRAAARDYDWVDSAVGPVTVRRGGQLGRGEDAETEIGRLTLAVSRRDKRIEILEQGLRRQRLELQEAIRSRNCYRTRADVWETRGLEKERENARLKLDLKAVEDRVEMLMEEVMELRRQQEILDEMLGREEERIEQDMGNIGVADVVVERGAQEEEPDYIEMVFEEAEEGEGDLTVGYLSAEE